MAEEVQGSVSGGNGERLELRVGSKAIGMTVKDLLPVLLLIGGLVGGYLIYTAVKHDLELLYARQEVILQGLHREEEKLRQFMTQLYKILETHDWNQGREPHERLPLVLEPPVPPRTEH